MAEEHEDEGSVLGKVEALSLLDESMERVYTEAFHKEMPSRTTIGRDQQFKTPKTNAKSPHSILACFRCTGRPSQPQQAKDIPLKSLPQPNDDDDFDVYVEEQALDEMMKMAPKKAPVKSKKAPMYSKKAPVYGDTPMKYKKKVGENLADEAVVRAMAVADEPREELKSTAFSETRFAKAFEDWARLVSEELKQSATNVADDAKNGYAWTLYAKARRWDETADGGDQKFIMLDNHSKSSPVQIPTSPPIENGIFSIENDPKVVHQFKFTIHPSFMPSTIVQTIPTISRVGWGSFTCGIQVSLRLNESQVFPLDFEHYLLLKESQVGTSESTYFVDIQGEKFAIQVGNTFGMIDTTKQEDATLADIAKNRANRRMRLEKTQQRLDEVRKSEKAIDNFIASCEHKRLGLGAVVAAILNGKEMNNDSFSALYQHGCKSLRCVILDEDNSALFARYMLGGSALGTELDTFDVSTDASGLTIDRFISHSWFDDAEAKCDTILTWAATFQLQHGRPARVWCDKFCLKQTAADLSMSVPCLPIYLLACDRVLLLRTHTFITRLWCLTEVYTNYVMRPVASSDKGFDIIEMDRDKPSNHVSVSAAKCSFKEDEDALRHNFDRAPGGIAEVEKALQAALI